MLKQEILLRRALRERGHSPGVLSIKVDHMVGSSTVNGTRISLVYPDSFFKKARSLWGRPKKLNFYFNGAITPSGRRASMLEAFSRVPGSRVIDSSFGRVNLFKGSFNWSYYSGLSQSRFGLCPHHSDWPGSYFWTYRFVECALVGTIPITFRETPLSESFTSGFLFYWDDSESLSQISNQTLREMAEENYNLALKRFSLPQLDF